MHSAVRHLVLSQCTRVTDRRTDRRTDARTDGRTDRITTPKTALVYARAVKMKAAIKTRLKATKVRKLID